MAEAGPEADPQATEDARLLVQIRSDPAGAIEAVLARYQAGLHRHAAAVLADATAAQDVVQESFLRLLANGRRIDNLTAWLHRVAHNLAIDHLRREARLRRLHREAAPSHEPTAETADRAVDAREARAVLDRALGDLTPNERAVVFLKVKEGRSYQEIAAMTGLSMSNVGYLLHHALKKLTAALAASGGKESVR
jgi:RNA polymerase sigma-70 factor (ECF subfamily)